MKIEKVQDRKYNISFLAQCFNLTQAKVKSVKFADKNNFFFEKIKPKTQ